MTETVRLWKDFGTGVIPMPHPSWRVTFWLKMNPWFKDDVLPNLRNRVQRLI
jgi:uracil-DNA glycosylase